MVQFAAERLTFQHPTFNQTLRFRPLGRNQSSLQTLIGVHIIF